MWNVFLAGTSERSARRAFDLVAACSKQHPCLTVHTNEAAGVEGRIPDPALHYLIQEIRSFNEQEKDKIVLYRLAEIPRKTPESHL